MFPSSEQVAQMTPSIDNPTQHHDALQLQRVSQNIEGHVQLYSRHSGPYESEFIGHAFIEWFRTAPDDVFADALDIRARHRGT